MEGYILVSYFDFAAFKLIRPLSFSTPLCRVGYKTPKRWVSAGIVSRIGLLKNEKDNGKQKQSLNIEIISILKCLSDNWKKLEIG